MIEGEKVFRFHFSFFNFKTSKNCDVDYFEEGSEEERNVPRAITNKISLKNK